ncbi:MAG: hypothetical protein H7067_02320 [Burkholderiales bacterium]|nr:hypothetical protein [Opitutaceae bacterium]
MRSCLPLLVTLLVTFPEPSTFAVLAGFATPCAVAASPRKMILGEVC